VRRNAKDWATSPDLTRLSHAHGKSAMHERVN
jgi:hypothetical protein